MADEVSKAAYIGYAFGIAVFFALGIPLQLVNLKALLHKDSYRKELTPYLINIAVANLIFMFASFPSSFVSAIKESWAFSRQFCLAEGFLSGTSSIAMICFLMVIIGKTHRAITDFSFVGHRDRRPRKNTIPIALVWLFSVVGMLPPLTGLTSMSLEGGGTNCAPEWRPANTGDLVYALVLTVFAFFVPITMSMRYLYKISQSLAQHKNVCEKNLRARVIIEYGSISRMIGAAIFLYIIAWTPYCFGVLISLFGGRNLLDGELSLLPTIIAKSSAVYIPIVYVTFNGRFRKIVVKVIRNKLRKGGNAVHPLTVESQSNADELQRMSVSQLPNQVHTEQIYTDLSSSNINRFNERRGAIRFSEVEVESGIPNAGKKYCGMRSI
ncbi:melanopsin-A [Exaiptasia diaphana]|uniref:G-protein coupled receptors family 1 profile domain-containing protein n=1 Tax=Exaiptasia diaphana TaxID=2652724 RepID=A0A913XMW2_EXADI|nr:melanopsin-A [Exaiptasia diaphana]